MYIDNSCQDLIYSNKHIRW